VGKRARQSPISANKRAARRAFARGRDRKMCASVCSRSRRRCGRPARGSGRRSRSGRPRTHRSPARPRRRPCRSRSGAAAVRWACSRAGSLRPVYATLRSQVASRVEITRIHDAGLPLGSDLIIGPGGRQILLADPDGNLIELFQPANRSNPQTGPPHPHRSQPDEHQGAHHRRADDVAAGFPSAGAAPTEGRRSRAPGRDSAAEVSSAAGAPFGSCQEPDQPRPRRRLDNRLRIRSR